MYGRFKNSKKGAGACRKVPASFLEKINDKNYNEKGCGHEFLCA